MRPPARLATMAMDTVTITVVTLVFTDPDLAAFEPGGMAIPFEVNAGTMAVNVAGFFRATMQEGGGTATVTLSGADAEYFTLTTDGTLTFNEPPDFFNPRGMALSDGNTNDYMLTITANPMVDIIVRVVENNAVPAFAAGATIPNQSYDLDTEITPLTLLIALPKRISYFQWEEGAWQLTTLSSFTYLLSQYDNREGGWGGEWERLGQPAEEAHERVKAAVRGAVQRAWGTGGGRAREL